MLLARIGPNTRDLEQQLAPHRLGEAGVAVGSHDEAARPADDELGEGGLEIVIDRPALLEKAKDEARQDDTPAFDAMVWEALRFVPIRPDIFRQAASDYTIAKGTGHETEIKAGVIVRLLTHSAMFDPYAFENPDQFDPDRNFYHNFNFGFGSHDCLGKYVGMVMVPEMVRKVMLLDDLESDGKISYRNDLFPDRDGPFPEKYQVTWSKAD